jgi:hypothetical protein
MYEKAENIDSVVSSLLSCGESPYSKERTESIVYDVLITAYNRDDSDKSKIKDVFTYEFACLNSAKNRSEYSKLHDLLTLSEQLRFCNSKNERYIIRSPNGGVIRNTPSTKGKRIGVVPVGHAIIGLRENKEWIKIVSRWGDGYMHESIF